ncbi:hypothetical protein MSPP1_002351 [Malassezia sp. CBS 17886]|nr:hypothetical protein MSPP1_002351 [Malassezia sp. CBS 17886]
MNAAPGVALPTAPLAHSAQPPAPDAPFGIDVFAPAFAPAGSAGGPYTLSREEILKGMANRFVHSTAYLYLYATMAALSLLTVVVSLLNKCPGPVFYLLELLVNLALVTEVGARLLAYGKARAARAAADRQHFWRSAFNVIDLGLVVVCLITLAVLFLGHGCSPDASRSGRGEELLDSVLLIVRNVVQCMRLISVVRRSGYSVTSRVAAINLTDVQGYNLDVDLEEESNLARQRMYDGGDHRDAGQGWSPHVLAAGQAHDTIITVDDASEL